MDAASAIKIKRNQVFNLVSLSFLVSRWCPGAGCSQALKITSKSCHENNKSAFCCLTGSYPIADLSCSNSEDSNEKSVIKETQDKIAQEAINYIKVPLDQAKEAGKLANEHNRQIEEALKKE